MTNLPPHAIYAQDLDLFAENGRDLDALLLGEMERLLTYPALGHIAQPDIPQEVLDACRTLRN